MQVIDNEARQDLLKIALVITELEPGGAEKCMAELALFLSARGHRVCVYSLGPAPHGSRAALVERLNSAGIAIQFGNARALTDLWRAKNWLRRSLLAFNPDIVQSMLWHANVVSAIALRGNKTPLIGGVRVAEPKRFRGWVQHWLAGRFSSFVCVSQEVSRQCREEGIESDKLVVIPNGIDIPSNEIPPKSWSDLELPRDSKVILFVGRLDPQKGTTALLEHADEFLTKAPDHHLVLIGQGKEQFRLHEIAGQRTNRNRIHLVGWQASAQDWMSAAELIVLPATYEGMPNVLLEAMSVGKPFVAFAVEGVSELLDTAEVPDLADRQIIARGDWPRFASRIVEFSLNDSLRRQIGQANQEHVQQHFQLSVQLGKYESLYSELVAHSCEGND